MIKKRPPMKIDGLIFFLTQVDYPRVIASLGQTEAQVPHSVHTSGLIE